LASVSGGKVGVVKPGKHGSRAFVEDEKKSPVELPRLMADFLTQIRLLYRLDVDFGEELKKQTDWRLELLRAPDPEQDPPRLTYPHILAPCNSRK